MSNHAEREGLQPQIDLSTSAGQKQPTMPFTVTDLGWKLFYEQWDKDEVLERNLHLAGRSHAGYMGAGFYYFVKPETGIPSEPRLKLNFSPFIAKGQVLAATLLFPVNSAYDAHPISADWEEWKQNPRRHEIFDPHNHFQVYDTDVSRIDDPTYLNPGAEIETAQVEVASDLHSTGLHQGWVTNPSQKARINEWFQAVVLGKPEDRKRIRHFAQLRQAPFRRRGMPENGEYTYAEIREEVVYGHRSPSTIDGRRTPNIHFFTQPDLEWLEEFMKNMGLPIPDQS